MYKWILTQDKSHIYPGWIPFSILNVLSCWPFSHWTAWIPVLFDGYASCAFASSICFGTKQFHHVRLANDRVAEIAQYVSIPQDQGVNDSHRSTCTYYLSSYHSTGETRPITHHITSNSTNLIRMIQCKRSHRQLICRMNKTTTQRSLEPFLP